MGSNNRKAKLTLTDGRVIIVAMKWPTSSNYLDVEVLESDSGEDWVKGDKGKMSVNLVKYLEWL